MRRGEIYWADLGPPAGRRPVVVLTRDAAIPALTGVVVAQITRSVRDIDSEVTLGKREGLPGSCVANCDSILTIAKSRCDRRPVGRLGVARLGELDAALVFALGIVP